jgi:ABC-2 type transport system permease protein
VSDATRGIKLLERETARVLIIIPPQFEPDILSREHANIQILIDGTDNSAGAAIGGYLGTVQQMAIKNIRHEEIPTSPITVKSRFLFNPELNSKWFVVPALAAVIMAILSTLLTALTISREWENGSMELLLSTPVRPFEVVVGKLLPYAILGLFSVAMVYFVARFLYGVPFVGSLCVFWFGTFLFLLTYLGQGLFISTAIRNQQAAIQTALVIGMMPTMLFSGFVFPIEAMPKFFQFFTYIFPARWYVTITRSQFLQGTAFSELFLPFSLLFLYAGLIVKLCVMKFKGNLE